MNELPIGASRTGDLYYGDENTPALKGTLERSERGISVKLSWSSPSDLHAAWFYRPRDYADGLESDGDEWITAPRRVLFHDSFGVVLLVRCWAQGYRASLLGPGAGTLWAQIAILGENNLAEFDSPHGLQTEISGLREWLGVKSWHQRSEPRNGDDTMIVTSQNGEPIKVRDEQGVVLQLSPGWGVREAAGGDELVLSNRLTCITRSPEPVSWDDHLDLHMAVRDLLVISRWRKESCVPIKALREDDLNQADGGTAGPEWRAVVVSSDERAQAPTGYRPHLILFSDIHASGIDRWISLRNEFGRALDPVISSLGLRDATPHTLLAHTGPGLEALGYLLLVGDGMSKGKAKNTHLDERLERILRDVGDSLPFEGSGWATSTAKAYNSLKHANRLLPDRTDMLNCWADSVMVVRAWVALRLQIPMRVVKSRLETDGQDRGYFKRFPE